MRKLLLFLVLKVLLATLIVIVAIPVVSACSSDNDCKGYGEFMRESLTSVVQWKCVDGECQKQDPVKVECTSNIACSEGYVCILAKGENQYTCIEQIVYAGEEFCGDGNCDYKIENNIKGTADYCPQDCDPNYKPEQKEVYEDTKIPDSAAALIIVIFVVVLFILLFKTHPKFRSKIKHIFHQAS